MAPPSARGASEMIVAASSSDAPCCVWDLSHGALLHSFPKTGAVSRSGACPLGPDHIALAESPLAGTRTSPAISIRSWHKVRPPEPPLLQRSNEWGWLSLFIANPTGGLSQGTA